MHAHLSDFVILLQCVFEIGLLNTRITKETGGARSLGGRERRE